MHGVLYIFSYSGLFFLLKKTQQGFWWVELLAKGQKGKAEACQRMDFAKQWTPWIRASPRDSQRLLIQLCGKWIWIAGKPTDVPKVIGHSGKTHLELSCPSLGHLLAQVFCSPRVLPIIPHKSASLLMTRKMNLHVIKGGTANVIFVTRILEGWQGQAVKNGKMKRNKNKAH